MDNAEIIEMGTPEQILINPRRRENAEVLEKRIEILMFLLFF
jgi:hypothetical protein